ncbi:MAG: Tudor-knot domain-containing protein [Pyrinomonadaceae bacterium]
MEKRIKHNLLHLFCIAIVAICIAIASSSLTFAQSQTYSVGEKIEVLWSGTWYASEVLEVKGGQYKIHYSDWASTFDEWVKPDRIRRVAKFAGEVKAKWGSRDAWRSEYNVGDKVEFSVSGKMADFQTCTVAENKPDDMMRVKCNAFKDWVAGLYIVFSEGTLRREKPTATDDDTPAVKEPKKTGKTSSSLKIGEYACTGSGGRMMIGLGFKVTSASRYTDLDGKRSGTFSIAGGKITFRGGHLEGVTGRDLKDNWFVVGAQASCGPYR